MPRKTTCECCDQGCPVHRNVAACGRPATETVRRIDMDDGLTRFKMCEGCAEDALASGVFA